MKQQQAGGEGTGLKPDAHSHPPWLLILAVVFVFRGSSSLVSRLPSIHFLELDRPLLLLFLQPCLLLQIPLCPGDHSFQTLSWSLNQAAHPSIARSDPRIFMSIQRNSTHPQRNPTQRCRVQTPSTSGQCLCHRTPDSSLSATTTRRLTLGRILCRNR